MEIFSEFNNNSNLSIALGYFDGVHIGHKKVIKTAVDYARDNNVKSAVITFKDHPCCYFWNVRPKYILTREERRKKISELGVDYLYELDFAQIAKYRADEYLKNVIIKYFSPVAISTGFNHNFGFNKSGNTAYLANMALKYNYKYFMTDAERLNNVVISSTEIRNLLSDGNIINANNMLGYSFFVSGIVVEGKQLGRTIGFRTANIVYPDELIDIPYGVYATLLYVDDKSYFAVTNYGIRPTISSDYSSVLESHIIEFNEDIYNKNIRVEFLYKIRNEIKFKSVDDLKVQIEKDISYVKSRIK